MTCTDILMKRLDRTVEGHRWVTNHFWRLLGSLLGPRLPSRPPFLHFLLLELLKIVGFQTFQLSKNLVMKIVDRYGPYGATSFSCHLPLVEILVRKNCVQDELTPFRGGESEALKRLRDAMDDKVCYWVSLIRVPAHLRLHFLLRTQRLSNPCERRFLLLHPWNLHTLQMERSLLWLCICITLC